MSATKDSLNEPLVVVGNNEVAFNYEKTFRLMTLRRVTRRNAGTYKKYTNWFPFLTVLFVAYSVGLWGIGSSPGSSSQQLSITTNVNSFIMGVVIIGCVLLLMLKIRSVLQWMIYTLLAVTALSYVLTKDFSGLFTVKKATTHYQTNLILLIILISLQLIIVTTYVVVHHIYPSLLRRDEFWKSYISWWKIRPTKFRNKFSYKNKRSFIYSGGVDSEGRPHGYGRWEEGDYDAFHGERLVGLFHHGDPIGPFHSVESGSGYTFRNIRIAVIHNRAETDLSSWNWNPSFSAAGSGTAFYGVVSVECSTSGAFFTSFPTVNVIAEPQPYQTISWVLNHVFSPIDHLMYRRNSSSTQEKEALVFIPGFNCSIDNPTKHLAQLLTLGDFPSSVVPFVFSWPSGSTLFYKNAITHGAKNVKNQNAFREMMIGLSENFKSVNIVAHSMGAQVLLNVLQDKVLQQHCVSQNVVSSVILLNPDYYLKDFVTSGYNLLRTYTSNITLYGDSNDGALYWSQVVSGCASLGRHFDKLVINETDEDLESHTYITPSSTTTSVVPVLHRKCTVTLEEMKSYHENEGVSEVIGQNLELDYQTTSNDVKNYLEMDVIDTTWMDQNVQSLRHNYFNLNPTLVEDLREVLVKKTRARDRVRLFRKAGNVYIFQVAPNHVVNQ